MAESGRSPGLLARLADLVIGAAEATLISPTIGKLRLFNAGDIFVVARDTIADCEAFFGSSGGHGRLGTVTAHDLLFLCQNNEVMRLDASGGDYTLNMTRRQELKKGSDIASGSTITLSANGNIAHVTGVTTINHVTTTGLQAGLIYYLRFTAALTVTHNAGSPPANTAPMRLAGGANFAATDRDMLGLYWDGVEFIEVSRSVNA